MILNRKALLTALKASGKVAARKGPRPILHNVLLTPCPTGLRLDVTDGEVWLTLTIPAESGDLLRACVPHASLLALVKARKDATVALDMLDDKRLRVDVAVILTDDPELFPTPLTLPDDTPWSAWPAATLAGALDRVSFAAARDMGRYAFNGILVDVAEGGTSFVATDGRRLAVQATACNGLPACKLILGAFTVATLRALLGKAPKGDVQVDAAPGVMGFAAEGWRLVANNLEGEFPDFRAVLPKPKDVPLAVRVEVADLLPAIEQAAITAGEQGRRVTLTARPGALGITSRHEGVGETALDIAAGMSCDGAAVGLNPEFLTEYLGTLPKDAVVEWRFRDRKSAVTLSEVGHPESLYVCMPITS